MTFRRRFMITVTLLTLTCSIALSANPAADFYRCIDRFGQYRHACDQDFPGPPYGNPDGWMDCNHKASLDFMSCIGRIHFGPLSLPYATGISAPSGLIYRFNNTFPPGQPVYLTVVTGGFTSGTITLNGAPVAAPADFASVDFFDKLVSLIPGQNEIVLNVPADQKGTLVAYLDTAPY